MLKLIFTEIFFYKIDNRQSCYSFYVSLIFASKRKSLANIWVSTQLGFGHYQRVSKILSDRNVLAYFNRKVL